MIYREFWHQPGVSVRAGSFEIFPVTVYEVDTPLPPAPHSTFLSKKHAQTQYLHLIRIPCEYEVIKLKTLRVRLISVSTGGLEWIFP